MFGNHKHRRVAFANELIVNVAPSTVGNYLSHLAAVFAVAQPAWAYPLDQSAMKDAFVVAKRLGIASKSCERDRRPTLEELDKIMDYFGERLKRRPSSIPMQKLVGFAIFSTRRLEEIAQISWKDLDVEGRRVLVRGMKNPGEKIGNNVWSDLPQEGASDNSFNAKEAPQDISVFAATPLELISPALVNSSRSLTCICMIIVTMVFQDYSKSVGIFVK